MELNYELELYDDMISKTLHPETIILYPPNKEQLQEWKTQTEQDAQRIKKSFRKKTEELNCEASRKWYIQFQLGCITRLVDILTRYLPRHKWSRVTKVSHVSTTEELYKQVYLQLYELLQYMRENFPNYFDNASKMPDAEKWKAEAGIRKHFLQIKQWLANEHDQVNSEFSELLCEPFESFLIPHSTYSYKELSYLQEYMAMLQLKMKTKKDIVAAIIKELFYLNFNSVLFFNYYILYLSAEASKRTTVTELSEFYHWHIKILNQAPVRPGCIYLKHLDPLRDKIVGWIAEDLNYLENKHQLTLPLPMNRRMQRDTGKKVHVNLTVADLSFTAQLLEDDFILNMNYTEIIEGIARNFRTDRMEHLSYNGLYNEGYDVSSKTREKMKGVFLRLARKVGEV